MCSVISYFVKNPSETDFLELKKIFIESMIRGKHATGISFINKLGTIETIILQKDAKYFVDKVLTDMQKFIADDGNFYIIGHCRYSTSDLKYNQPIYSDNTSIVHNGVITQEPFENWKNIIDVNFKTKNDSEFLLYSKNPLCEFLNSSISCCILNDNKSLLFFRNGKRPLWFSKTENKVIVVSTADIGKRVGLLNMKKSDCNCYYKINNWELIKYKINTDKKDLQ